MRENEPGGRALARLMEGNRAFLAGKSPAAANRAEIERLCVEGQRPIAAILCCADSRAAPELIFCQGIGKLFSIRTAGNVASALELGSVEYAVTQLGVRLVLALGHSRCGAVAGALEGCGTGCLSQVLKRIVPSVERARREALFPGQVAELAENYNIRRSLEQLRANPVLAAVSGLVFAAAKYDTLTGAVTVLEQS